MVSKMLIFKHFLIRNINIISSFEENLINYFELKETQFLTNGILKLILTLKLFLYKCTLKLNFSLYIPL